METTDVVKDKRKYADKESERRKEKSSREAETEAKHSASGEQNASLKNLKHYDSEGSDFAICHLCFIVLYIACFLKLVVPMLF